MEPQSRNDVINKQLHDKYETALQLCNRTIIMQLHCNYATALQLCNYTTKYGICVCALSATNSLKQK